MTLTYLHVLVAVGAVFGLIGFLRGVAREVITTIGIIIAYLIVRWGESFLIGWTNRFFKMAIFAVRGGLVADDPTAIWAQVRELPPLIEAEGEKLIFKLVVFAALVILAYIVGNRLLPARKVPFGPLVIYAGPSLPSRLLGLAAGVMNGYLIAYFVIPQAFPKPETVIKVPTEAVVKFLNQNLPLVFIGLVVILIVLGLWSASLKK